MNGREYSSDSRNTNDNTYSEFHSYDEKLNKIARHELNSFSGSQNMSFPERKKVLDEHLQNNSMIEELSNSAVHNERRSEQLGDLCRDQISSAKERAITLQNAYPNSPLPKHEGYNRLIKLLEENNELPYILELCLDAKEQGWEGNWDDQIKRVKNKMKK